MLNEAQFGKYHGSPQFPLQLTMFEQAGTLAHTRQVDTLLTGRSADEVRAEKLAESESPSYADAIRETETDLAQRPDRNYQVTMDDAPTLAESIRQGGIRRPVLLSLENGASLGSGFEGTPDVLTVGDGQHRVAVQNRINPHAEVPVEWQDWRE